MPRLSEKMQRLREMEEAFIASERLISINTAARILTRSRDYVVELLDTRQLPFVRCGNRRKIDRRDLMAFIHKLKQTAANKPRPLFRRRAGSPPMRSCVNDPDIQALLR